MKTEIRYSYIYNLIMLRDLNFNYSNQKFNELKRNSKEFENLYIKYIKKIISLIEKNTQRKKWKNEFIPIYITEKIIDDYSGFSDPLTLKIRDSKKMLHTLIHELVHNNLDEYKQIKSGNEKNEKLVKEITEKVWGKLNIK